MDVVPDNAWPVAVRGAALALLTTAGTAVLATLLGRFTLQAVQALAAPGGGSSSGADLETFLAAAVAAIGALVAGWYTLSASIGTCCTLARAVGSTWQAGELLLRRRGAPGVARLVGAGTGALLTASLVLAPAQADSPEPAPDPAVAEDLTWAAAAEGPTASASAEDTTDDTSAEASPANASPAEASAAESSPAPSSPATGARPSTRTDGDYVVQNGDTLWAIAALHLDPGATTARVAAAWPGWYEANRAAIGADPDLILPGTVLHEPD